MTLVILASIVKVARAQLGLDIRKETRLGSSGLGRLLGVSLWGFPSMSLGQTQNLLERLDSPAFLGTSRDLLVRNKEFLSWTCASAAQPPVSDLSWRPYQLLHKEVAKITFKEFTPVVFFSILKCKGTQCEQSFQLNPLKTKWQPYIRNINKCGEN